MLTRRSALTLLAATTAAPTATFASTPRETWWEDLIPPAVPYSEFIGEGDMDVENDTWAPIYDANGVKLNEALDGVYIKMPGFILPLDVTSEGVKDFILVPYVGACIHVPPPPANQLVVASAQTAWPSDQLWDAVWVTGTMRTQLQSTQFGQTGYSISVDEMEIYVW